MQFYAFGVHKQQSIRVGVLGASGYAGRELCALIAGHPRFALAFATANAQRGTTLRVRAAGRVHDVALVGAEEVDLTTADLVFVALPHGASAEWVARVIAAGARVVAGSVHNWRAGLVRDRRRRNRRSVVAQGHPQLRFHA